MMVNCWCTWPPRRCSPPARAGRRGARKPSPWPAGDRSRWPPRSAARPVANGPALNTTTTLAWATSPLLITRLQRRLAIADAATRPPSPSRIDPRSAYVCAQHASTLNGRNLAFGPFVLTAEADTTVTDLARWITGQLLPVEVAGFTKHIQRNLVVVDDQVLASLTRECTEIHARVQLHRDLDKLKTVQNGPFHAEYLPSETLFTSLALGPQDALAQLGDALGGVWNIGGHESIGKGLVWCRPELVTAANGPAAAGPAAAGSVATGPAAQS
jgi:CRISPR-associated protein Cmr4